MNNQADKLNRIALLEDECEELNDRLEKKYEELKRLKRELAGEEFLDKWFEGVDEYFMPTGRYTDGNEALELLYGISVRKSFYCVSHSDMYISSLMKMKQVDASKVETVLKELFAMHMKSVFDKEVQIDYE